VLAGPFACALVGSVHSADGNSRCGRETLGRAPRYEREGPSARTGPKGVEGDGAGSGDPGAVCDGVGSC